jgi:hypothetical protein
VYLAHGPAHLAHGPSDLSDSVPVQERPAATAA